MPELSVKRKSPNEGRSPDMNQCEFNFSCPLGQCIPIITFNLLHTLLGSVYLRVILISCIYLRVIFNLFYTHLGSVYLRVNPSSLLYPLGQCIRTAIICELPKYSVTFFEGNMYLLFARGVIQLELIYSCHMIFLESVDVLIFYPNP